MDTKRVEFTVLGRVIGTATGWDELGGSDIILYDFLPSVETELPAGDLCVLFEKGIFEMHDDAGNLTFTSDIIGELRNVARAA